MPDVFPLSEEDDKERRVWVLGQDSQDNEIRLTTGERYRVKRFHAIYKKKGTIPEDLQGIAVVHNNMKIVSLAMSSAPPQVRERVTGYIEFDRELDQELRKGINVKP